MKIIKKYKEISFLTKMLVALIFGGIVGWIVGPPITVIKPIGTFFINALKMVALPLIIANVIAGVSSLDDPRSFGRIGGRILGYYAITTTFAMALGIVIANIVKPGVGIEFEGTMDLVVDKAPSILDTLLGIIPTNIFASLTAGRFDQVVIFCLFVGVTILFLPKDFKDPLAAAAVSTSKLFTKMIGIVMGIAPFGVFAMIASTMGEYGNKLVGTVLKYIGAMYLSIVIMIILYLTLVAIFAKMSPIHFLKKTLPLIVTTLSTSSSLVSLPVSLKCADSLEVPRNISDFTVPLGMQLNKDGNGIMLTLAVVMAAQSAGVAIPLVTLINVMILSLILTTGGGGIPGAAPIHMAIVVQTFGLPIEIIAIIAGIFPLVDAGVTTINMVGDLAGTVIVSKGEERRLKKLSETVEFNN